MSETAPSRTTSITTSNQKPKNKWKNDWQKLVATTVSSREVGSKCREEGKTMRSRVYTETHKDQRDDKRKGNGGGRQKLKHVDGDFPCCMRRKSVDKEAKVRENENLRGKEGSRHKLRNVDGDDPLSMRSYCGEHKDSSSSKKEITDGSSKKGNRSKTACGSKDLCGSKTK